MDAQLIFSILLIIFLMLLSAFFAGSETALTAASEARMHAAEKEGDRLSGLVSRILRRKEQMIGALLLGNSVVNITASAIATSVFIRIFGEHGVLYASGVMTALVVIFAEVMPKTYAFQNADRMARMVAIPVRIVISVLAPVTGVITHIVRFTLKVFGVDISKVHAGNHLEILRGVIDMHTGPEEEVNKQRAMLHSILDLADVSVDEVMIHRKNVLKLNIDLPPEQLIGEALNSPYSRIPLWKDSPENIVGVIHTKWLLRELKAVGDLRKVDINKIMGEPWFIPDTTNLYDQLQAFKERGEHFAFIVDEYGSFQGVITLEDILEEIVGDINDEHDVHVPGVRRQQNGTFLVSGNVTIRDLHRELNWDELPDEDYSTVAGLVLYEARAVPEVGQSFKFFNFQFDILRRHRNQITLVRITPPPHHAA